MNDFHFNHPPARYAELQAKGVEIGFTMPSDMHIGALLKCLVASKPNGNFLELGTGLSLSLSWMIDGMDKNSALTTIDNDPALIEISESYFGKDQRVTITCCDGGDWIRSYTGDSFDLIFADAWPGKYQHLDETLELIKVGGYYVIDDMAPQPNWPDDHDQKVERLIDRLERRADFFITRMNWSTGVLLCTKHK